MHGGEIAWVVARIRNEERNAVCTMYHPARPACTPSDRMQYCLLSTLRHTAERWNYILQSYPNHLYAFDGCKCPLPGGKNAYLVYMYFLARAWEAWISTTRQHADVLRTLPPAYWGSVTHFLSLDKPRQNVVNMVCNTIRWPKYNNICT